MKRYPKSYSAHIANAVNEINRGRSGHPGKTTPDYLLMANLHVAPERPGTLVPRPRIGIEQDKREAQQWFAKAAWGGDTTAMRNLYEVTVERVLGIDK